MALTMEMVREAQKRLKGVVRTTPLTQTKNLGENVYIKAENLQVTGAFKIRGAYNLVSSLTPEERVRGVIACSAGNHAQGIALSATKLGCRSIICMPAAAPISKVEATKKYGAEVILVDGVYDDAAAEAERLTREKGYTFAHPFNDPRVMAGQGTIALEILDQLPDVEQIVVPIGGGGLISGMALAIKTLKPSCKMIGVQAANVASMYDSLRAGKIITLPGGDTIADGIHVMTPGDQTFELCRKYVDDVVVVKEDEIAAAILTLLDGNKTVAEGAGATTVAACMFGKVDVSSKKTVCLVSGGNVDVTTLSRIITKGMVKTGRITEFSTKIGDRPGKLIEFLQLVSETGANIIHVEHSRENKRSEVDACVVSLTLETRDMDHIEKIRETVTEKGYQIIHD